MPKAISKAQLHNIIKIHIGDLKKKKKRKSRRKSTQHKKHTVEQLQQLHDMVARPSMRPVQQDSAEKVANKLILESLLNSNEAVVKAVNSLGTPSHTTGYAPPSFHQAPKKDEYDERKSLLEGLSRNKLRDIYKKNFNASANVGNTGKGKLIKMILDKNPSIDMLKTYANDITLSDREANINYERGGGGGGEAPTAEELPPLEEIPPLEEPA